MDEQKAFEAKLKKYNERKIQHFDKELLINDKIAVHCSTKEQGIEIYLWALEYGIEWNFNPWCIYEERTCVIPASKEYLELETALKKTGLTVKKFKDVKTKKQKIDLEGWKKELEESKIVIVDDKPVLKPKEVEKEVIKKEFFLEDHLPSSQRKWLNFKKGILEDVMKRKEKTKVKGKNKLSPTKEAKEAKKEYNIIMELIKNIVAGEPILAEFNVQMGTYYDLFNENILPGRNIPNNSYEGPITKEEPKKKKKKKRKKTEEFESGDTLETDPGLAIPKEA